jgi:hypothetical protein
MLSCPVPRHVRSGNRRGNPPARRRDTDLATYGELARGYRQVGARAARLDPGRPVFSFSGVSPAHRTDLVEHLFDRAVTGAVGNAAFDEGYRRAWPGQDESLSTASMRSLLAGVADARGRDGRGVSGARLRAMRESVVAASEVRMPTEYVGTHTAGEFMQHPSSTDGLYDRTRATAARHNWHDRSRAVHALSAMSKEVDRRGATFGSVLGTGVAAAAAYTVNRMMAPPLARNVLAISRRPGDLQDADTRREGAKDDLVAAGKATRARGAQAHDALFTEGRRLTEVSPPRSRPSALRP